MSIPPQTRGKPVKSTDPRKKLVMDKLKQEARAQRITNVREHRPGVFSGDALRRVQLVHWEFERAGRYWVQFELDRDGNLGQHVDGGSYDQV